MSLLSSQGRGAFFSHKIILMGFFGTFKIKRFWRNDLALVCSSLQLFRGNIRSYSKLSDKKTETGWKFFSLLKNNRITIFSTDNQTEDRNNLKRRKKRNSTMINDWKYCIVQMPRSCFRLSCFTRYKGPTGTDRNETDSSVSPMTKEKIHPRRIQNWLPAVASRAKQSLQPCPAL